MMVKVRENLDRLGGETFQPEFKETYKDKKGGKEEAVHVRFGGKGLEEGAEECVYDDDSSGGVKLSPSDLK